MRGLVFVGGWAHPAAQTGPATAAALGSLGVETTVADSFDAATSCLANGEIDLLVVHACRFMMEDGRYTSEQRASFASATPGSFRSAVSAHLDAGKPLLALHTAVLCFDDWTTWPEVVGGSWDWQRSNHPPPGVFTVIPTGELAPTCTSFDVVDELYRFVEPHPGSEIVAVATDSDGITHPVAWRQQRSAARVAYSSLGHDDRSMENPSHRAFLGALVSWLGSVG